MFVCPRVCHAPARNAKPIPQEWLPPEADGQGALKEQPQYHRKPQGDRETIETESNM